MTEAILDPICAPICRWKALSMKREGKRTSLPPVRLKNSLCPTTAGGTSGQAKNLVICTVS